MARGRLISRTLGSSRKFAALQKAAGRLAEFSQALYPLLIACSDDFGRQAGDAFTVKLVAFPSSPRKESEFATAIAALTSVELIRWYEAQNGQVIEIVDFDAHQTGLHKRTESKFPGFSGKFPEVPPEEKGRDTKRYEEKRNEPKGSSAPPKTATTEPALLSFSTVGRSSSWALTSEHVAELQGTFPNLDVLAECRRAWQWVRDNPGRRKTPQGMPKFLSGWMARTTDSGRGMRVLTPPETTPDIVNDRGEDWYAECQRLHAGECNGQHGHRVRMQLAVVVPLNKMESA